MRAAHLGACPTRSCGSCFALCVRNRSLQLLDLRSKSRGFVKAGFHPCVAGLLHSAEVVFKLLLQRFMPLQGRPASGLGAGTG